MTKMVGSVVFILDWKTLRMNHFCISGHISSQHFSLKVSKGRHSNSLSFLHFVFSPLHNLHLLWRAWQSNYLGNIGDSLSSLHKKVSVQNTGTNKNHSRNQKVIQMSQIA